MKKVLFIALALMLLGGLAADADAMMGGKMHGKQDKGMGKMDMGMGKHEMGSGMHEGHMMKKVMALGLDDKQKEAVQAIHFRWKKEAIRKNADIEIAEMELKEILSKDPVDIKAAEQKIRQIETLKADMHVSHLKIHEEVKAKLTPEQKKKLHSMMEMGPMGMGMGHMGGVDRMGGCMMMQGMDHGDDKPAAAEQKPVAAPAAPAGHKHH